MHDRRTAFSLIELLVVISIIAVLASMLLPAIGMVKGAAQSVNCSSNLRQFGLGFNTYIEDSNHIWPYTSFDPTGKVQTWQALIQDYVDAPTPTPPNFKLARCPAAPLSTKAGAGLLTTYAYTGVYAATFSGAWGAFFTTPDRYFPFYPWWTGGGRPRISSGSIYHPDEKCIISERWVDNDILTNTAWYNDILNDMKTLKLHRVGSNFLYADGHVQTMVLPAYFKPMTETQFAGSDYNDPMWFPRNPNSSKLAR